jgi:hypothetical protein
VLLPHLLPRALGNKGAMLPVLIEHYYRETTDQIAARLAGAG